MKNILFLTDFSESSIHAIHYTCNLFSKNTYNYFLLYVSKPVNVSSSKLAGSESIYDTVIGDKKNKLKELKSFLENTYDTTFKASVRFGGFLVAIENYVSKYNIDIIVAGFDGANSIQEKVFGSNTLKLIRSVYTNTLIIPQQVSIKTPKNLFCLLDGQDDLKLALKEQLISNKNLKIIRVIDNDDNSIADYDKSILKEYKNIQYSYQLISKIPLHHVKSYVMQTKAIDLTVLLIQKTSVIERLFEGNSTTKISKSLKKPILIIHE